MPVTLDLLFEDVETFDTNQFYAAKAYADKTNGKVYSWKSEGLSNWLEKGYSKANLCYFVVLPKALPSYIDMPDDPRYEEGDDVDLEYTKHANRALRERMISEEQVAQVVSMPALRGHDPTDPTVERFFGPVPGQGGCALRVSVNTRMDPWLVVNVFFDRNLKGAS